jgi:hypothetical protein
MMAEGNPVPHAIGTVRNAFLRFRLFLIAKYLRVKPEGKLLISSLGLRVLREQAFERR